MLIINILTVIYLFLFSLYHIFTGLVSIFFPNFSLHFYKKIYGFEPKEKKQLLMILKPWGNLALTVGIIGFITLYYLQTFYPMLFAFGLLLTIRIWYRYTYREEIEKEFKITSNKNWQMIIFQLIGAALFFIFATSHLFAQQ